MLKDVRTWTTLLYFLLMLPLGIIYFCVATVGLAFGLRLALAPVVVLGRDLNFLPLGIPLDMIQIDGHGVASPHTFIGALIYMVLGLVILALLMHVARGIGRGHARLAKSLLVEPGA